VLVDARKGPVEQSRRHTFLVSLLRLPHLLRADDFHDYRGCAGTVASGVLRTGDEVQVLPSGLTTTIAGIDSPRGPVDEAFAPMSVTLRLADDLDVSRGDLICRPGNVPQTIQDLDALVCWMTDEPLRPRRRLVVKRTTRTVRAVVRS
jgi:bifunctional enzyme CysN/CysC